MHHKHVDQDDAGSRSTIAETILKGMNMPVEWMEFLKFCTLKFHCLYMFKSGKPDLDKSKLIPAPLLPQFCWRKPGPLLHHMQLNMLLAILLISYYTMLNVVQLYKLSKVIET